LQILTSGTKKYLLHYPQHRFRKEIIDYERTDVMIYLNEETFQARKVHACGQPCEESIYEIKGQEQIGRQEIYKQKRTEQNRTEQNIVRPWKGEAAAAVWGEMRCVVK